MLHDTVCGLQDSDSCLVRLPVSNQHGRDSVWDSALLVLGGRSLAFLPSRLAELALTVVQLVLLIVHCVDCMQVLWQVFQGTAGAVGVHGGIDAAALCAALTASKDLQHLLDLGSGVFGIDLQQSFVAAVQQVPAHKEPPSSWHTFMQVRCGGLL